MPIAAIDGDEVAYKIASTYQKKYYGVYKDGELLWKSRTKEDAIESVVLEDEDFQIEPIVLIKEPDGYQRKVNETINNILTNTRCNEFVICLSGDKNFRYDIATLLPYKGNRDGQDKPGHYPLIRDYLLNSFHSLKEEHLEADDLMTHLGHSNDDYIICSTDKDLRTVESINYNISTQKLQRIDYPTALYNFYYQLLIGDSVDNIPWPYNLGKVTATNILSEIKGSISESKYITHIYPYYIKYLTACDKQGEYKTKWFNDDLSFKKILWEVGNLIYMHRTLDINERWELPEFEEVINGEEKECESKEEGELELLESIAS